MNVIYEDRFEKEINVANYYGYLGLKPNGLHLHRHVETQYLIRGSVEFTVDDRVYNVAEGLLVIFPYQPHSNAASPEAKQVSAIINPNSFDCYAPTLFDYYPRNNFIPNSELPVGFRDLIEYGFHISHDHREIPFKERIMTDITAVVLGTALSLLDLVSRRDETSAESVSMIGRVINYCVTHLSEDLSLDTLSKVFFVDKSYISRLFRKKLGISYVEFISSQRVSTACELLAKTPKSITEIAFDCGFRNQSSFNRIFQSQRGMTPSEYRKKQI